MTKNTKAFTLIELLIVIVIIGILAVALIPRLTGAQASARDTARKSTLQQAATIISSYVAQESTNALNITDDDPAVALDTTNAKATVTNYGSLPVNGPQGTADEIYVASGGNNKYVYCATLERKNGNFAGNCSAITGGTVAGDVASANTGWVIVTQG